MSVSEKYVDSELLLDVCEHIAGGGSLRQFDFKPYGKTERGFYLWLNDRASEQELQQYTRARESQAEAYLDEIIEIADNSTDDVELITTERGEKEVIKHSAIQRARLQIDTRKWAMGKLKPKKYGESKTIKGDQENPLVVSTIDTSKMDSDTLEKIVAASDASKSDE